MYAVAVLVLAGLATTVQGMDLACYGCAVIPGKDFDYCCTNFNDDSHYCCSFEDYYFKGGALDSKTLLILVSVGAAVLFLLFVLICCCCCSCCPCYRRRQRGAVYNSVVRPSGAQAYQPNSAQYYPAQYPPQPSSNPYIAPTASAPAYPTLLKV